ncbi:MAG TPA: ribose ABC transporter permease [Opitutaceae bacterium]|nr:ribose ABC transporter permease [Opitutaceae bacterium]
MKARELIANHARQFGTLAVLLVLGGAISLCTPHFLTVANLLNVAQQTVVNALVAAGLTFVIISGGIDLSVGSILALAGIVMAHALRTGWPAPLAVLAGLAVGAGCGAVNGGLVAFGRLPPFIATLGMMSVARGGALLASDGRPVSGFSAPFRWLATGEVAAVPASVLLLLVVYAAAHFTLQRTKFGRYAFAIGGSEEAALLSGVPVRRYQVGFYAAGGGLAALAAVVLTARLNSAQPIAGLGYELDAIAAAVIGGTSLMGGQGSIVGTLLGAFIMGVLRNGLNLLGVSSFVQQVVIGAVIIAAVLFDVALKRTRR